MNPGLLTILVVARNARATIRRCICSALAEGCSVILVDDCSDDGTAEAAVGAGLTKGSVLRVAPHVSLGFARQRGLEAVRTPFTMLLDADDELLPGRVARFLRIFEATGCDAIADEVELYDGISGGFMCTMTIPAFLENGEGMCRLFERNYLPGIGQIAFRTQLFRELGYDESLTGPEDSDIVLRALLANARFWLEREVGYRMYHYSSSVSRDIDKQNDQLSVALRKHNMRDVAVLFAQAGVSERVTAWALHSLAVFRREWNAAEALLREACPSGSDLNQVLEPEGPERMREGWRLNFARGVIAAMKGETARAVAAFRGALEFDRSVDALNNLGVSLRLQGDEEAAEACFEEAVKVLPGYLDARVNRDNRNATRFTRRPLRRDPGRSVYGS